MTEIERKNALKAISAYELSDNFKALKEEAEERKKRAKATVVTAYLTKSDEGAEYTEQKIYNHKNKFAWGIETMEEMIALIDDSEGGKVLKARIQEGIENSEEHIGSGLVRIFPGSGGVVEYRYSDVEFTDSDRIVYKAQVAGDSVKLVSIIKEELSKQAEEDVDEAPIGED